MAPANIRGVNAATTGTQLTIEFDRPEIDNAKVSRQGWDLVCTATQRAALPLHGRATRVCIHPASSCAQLTPGSRAPTHTNGSSWATDQQQEARPA